MPPEIPKTKYNERRLKMAELSKLRNNRVPIIFFNFDRGSQPPSVPGLSTIFASDTKEVLYRLLRESNCTNGVDLVLYTRGGDTNAVWPLVNLIREFDPKFEVLVPFRCHSSGTLLALGANKVVMTKLAELSPIDPTTANQFNPREETNPIASKGISVEDVRAFVNLKETHSQSSPHDYVEILTRQVHPLALGNVQRAFLQVRNLAEELLEKKDTAHAGDKDHKKIVEKLSSGFYSHSHAISRVEARKILGEDHVLFADEKLEQILDEILRIYEQTFELRRQYVLKTDIADNIAKEVSYIGGVFECEKRSYLFRTEGTWFQTPRLPQNVNLNIQVGSPLPLIPGLPTDVRFDLRLQDWVYNEEGI